MGGEEVATEALINHDLARQLALEAARWRDGVIRRRDSDVDIPPFVLRVICEQM